MSYKIQDDSLEFSIAIVAFCKSLDNNKEYIVSKQLLRSATSIWANIREAKFASTDKDYIHKLRISLREANETCYRLKLIIKSVITADINEATKLHNWSNKITWTLVNIINSKLRNMR